MALGCLHARMAQQDLNRSDRYVLLKQANRERVAEAMGTRVDTGELPKAIHCAAQTSKQARQFPVPTPEDVLLRFARERIERIDHESRKLHVSCIARLHESQKQTTVFSEARPLQLSSVRDPQSGVEQKQEQRTRSNPSTRRALAIVVLDAITRGQQEADFIGAERKRRSRVAEWGFQNLRRVAIHPAAILTESAEGPKAFEFSSLCGRRDLSTATIRGEQFEIDPSNAFHSLLRAEAPQWVQILSVPDNGALSQTPRPAVFEVRLYRSVHGLVLNVRLVGLTLDALDASYRLAPVAQFERLAKRSAVDFPYRPDRAKAVRVILPLGSMSAISGVPSVQPKHGMQNITKDVKACTTQDSAVQSSMPDVENKRDNLGRHMGFEPICEPAINNLAELDAPQKKQKRPEAAQSVRASTGHVYFVEAVGTGRVKIGFSDNWRARVNDLQVGCPFPLRRLLVIPGTITLESEMHLRFRDHRIQGEWFTLCPEIEAFLAGECKAGLVMVSIKSVSEWLRVSRNTIKQVCPTGVGVVSIEELYARYLVRALRQRPEMDWTRISRGSGYKPDDDFTEHDTAEVGGV